MTQEEIYKKNQKKAKIFKILSPVVFWGCLALAIIALIFAIHNSFGNIAEICHLLDNKSYNGEQIAENYNYLKDKWGEWVIGDGSNGFCIVFINIGHALFSGVMMTSCLLSVTFLVCAWVLGKWLFPQISNQILQENTDVKVLVKPRKCFVFHKVTEERLQ